MDPGGFRRVSASLGMTLHIKGSRWVPAGLDSSWRVWVSASQGVSAGLSRFGESQQVSTGHGGFGRSQWVSASERVTAGLGRSLWVKTCQDSFSPVSASQRVLAGLGGS